MDFGKYRYEMSKREKIQKKHQHTTQVKEIRFHPTTDTHDFEFKTRHARQFLEDGNKVKLTMMFRGRQVTHPELKAAWDDLVGEAIGRLMDIGNQVFRGRHLFAGSTT